MRNQRPVIETERVVRMRDLATGDEFFCSGIESSDGRFEPDTATLVVGQIVYFPDGSTAEMLRVEDVKILPAEWAAKLNLESE